MGQPPCHYYRIS